MRFLAAFLAGLTLGCVADASDCDRACLAVEDACNGAVLEGQCGGNLELCTTLAAACFEECP